STAARPAGRLTPAEPPTQQPRQPPRLLPRRLLPQCLDAPRGPSGPHPPTPRRPLPRLPSPRHLDNLRARLSRPHQPRLRRRPPRLPRLPWPRQLDALRARLSRPHPPTRAQPRLAPSLRASPPPWWARPRP